MCDFLHYMSTEKNFRASLVQIFFTVDPYRQLYQVFIMQKIIFRVFLFFFTGFLCNVLGFTSRREKCVTGEKNLAGLTKTCKKYYKKVKMNYGTVGK